MRVLFLIALGVAAYLVYKLYLRQLLSQGTAGRVKLGLIVVGFLFLALALTGRAPAVFALVGALMTQALRFWPLLVRFAPGLARHLGAGNPFVRGASKAGTSQVRTPTILMTLEHASGQMDGEVLDGEFAGRHLSALGASELVRLHAHCRANDAEALRLLEAYVARERAAEFENAEELGGASAGSGGHDGAGGGTGGGGSGGHRSGGRMDVVEAAEVLGLPPDADREAIIAAHRTLMSRLHPDKGGSDYLATKVNAARAVLLDALDG